MNTAIDTLIFDLDDTLIIEEASAETAFIQAGELARARHGLDPAQLHAAVRKTCRELWYGFPSHPYCKRIGISSWEGMWAEFTGDAPELKPLHAWRHEYRINSWLLTLRALGVDDPELAAELAERYPRLREKLHVLYPRTLKTLEQASLNHRLGLLTNGAPDVQRRKIEGANLGQFFDHVLISGEVGTKKPNSRVFEMLLEQLGSTAATSLMIGNSLENDIQGAQQLGMRTVWVNRSGKALESHIVPDWEIATLEELAAILKTPHQKFQA
jgi:putative hydrolase of the HAD superfamily